MTSSVALKPASSILRQDRPIFGIVLINLAVVVFTSMDAVIKGVSETFPTGELVFFRNLFAFGPILGFMMWQGRRLGHILDPRTGWPVENAPRSVTVLGSTCIEAGSLATMAYLKGPGASEFLRDQGVQFWVL